MESNSIDSFDQDPVGNRKPENHQHNECLKILNLVLDDEATSEQKEYFVKHLNNCMPCYESYNVDVAIRDLIKSKCCGKKVPNDLVTAIRSSIMQQAD